MGFRKIKANQLFNGMQLLGSDHVLVIKSDGEIVDIITQSSAEDEYFPGIITPGFINAHCHLELSHMKGHIPGGTGLVDFVFRVVTERSFNESGIATSVEREENAMLDSGIVAVGDICNNASTLSQKLKGRMKYYNFIEASGWDPANAEKRFERSKMLYDDFSACFKKTTIIPHAAYSVSERLWDLIVPYFKDKVVSIHNQETPGEDEFFIEGKGALVKMYEKMQIDNSFFMPLKKSSIRHTFSKLAPASQVILVHNTFIGQDDIDHIHSSPVPLPQVSFCLCVNANLYIENAVPPVDMLLRNHCNIILGTDSIASNWSLNILDEMRSIQKHFPSVSLEMMLGWATLNGARALQMDDVLGSFDRGKKPGVVLLENLENGKLGGKTSSRRII